MGGLIAGHCSCFAGMQSIADKGNSAVNLSKINSPVLLHQRVNTLREKSNGKKLGASEKDAVVDQKVKAELPQRDQHKEGAVTDEYVNVDPWTRYEEVEEVGKGKYGTVMLAKDRKTGHKVAIKRVLQMGGMDEEQNKREISILKKLDHDNICKMSATYVFGRHRYFIMEYLEGGELFDYILENGRVSEDVAKKIFYQVARAMQYAHANGVAHRDLKPENICLVSKSRLAVKLIDWGHGAILQGLQRTTTPDVGTMFYQAPEVQEARVTRQTYTTACDIWSLGVLLYVMLSGGMTAWAEEEDFGKALQAKKNETFPMGNRTWKSISMEAKDLVKSLLKANPEDRLPIEEVLLHPWLTRSS